MSLDQAEAAQPGRQQTVILFFLLSALSHPLSSLSQHPESDPAGPLVFPASHAAAARLVTAIAEVTENILADVLKWEGMSVQDDEPLNQTSLGTFLYILLGEGLCLDRMPAVYSKLFLLQRSSTYISILLK